MSYYKMTTIIARKTGYVAPTAAPLTDARYSQVEANQPYTIVSTRSGHWSPEKALAAARRMGAVGPVEVTHSTADMSGKGRGGDDAKYVGDETGMSRIPLSPAVRGII